MGLIGNYSVLNKSPGRFWGGNAVGGGADKGNYQKSGALRGRFNAPEWEPKSGVPDGYRPPYTWLISQTPGTLSSRNIITGTGTLTAFGALGRNLTATMTGTGTLTATGDLIVSAIATLTGSGSITVADLLAVIQATATLTGSGSLTATPTALGWMEGSLTGVGTLTSTPFGTGALTATISPSTGETLSPEAVAAAVWAAIAITNSDSGSMGEKLNAALTLAKYLGLK
jgi:hypothetical protein